VALLIDESARADGMATAFRDMVESSCPGTAITVDRSSDAAAQAQQLTERLATGPASVVIEAVDPTTAAALVSQAQAAGASVVVLGDDIPGSAPAYRIAYDPAAAGGRISEVVLEIAQDAADMEDEDAEPTPGPIERVVLIGGPADDAALSAWATAVKEGLGTDATIVHEASVAGLTAIEGKRVIEEAIAAVGADGFGAVIAPDDAVAAGVIEGLRTADIPVGRTITGGGGTLPGTRAIVSGTQTLTTWSPPGPAAQVAGVLACAAATGSGTPEGLTLTPIDTGSGAVSTVVLTPIVVGLQGGGDLEGTRSVEATIVEDLAFGPDTAAQICADLADACDAAGIVVPQASPSPGASASPVASPATSPVASEAPVASPVASVVPQASAAATAPPVASPAASTTAP
jgi:D-xylose transport system substrate-binding protein